MGDYPLASQPSKVAHSTVLTVQLSEYVGLPVTLNNASDYWANGLLSDYIGWPNGITDYRANTLTV